MPTEREMKERFAEALLKNPDNVNAAAFQICDDPGVALQLAHKWFNDPELKAIQATLMEKNGLRSYLPSKDEQAKDIYAMAEDKKLDVEERLKAHRLYAEIMGNIEKPTNPTQVNVQTNLGVMLVPVAQNDEEWEKRAQEQQRRLTEGSIVINSTEIN
jgi:hypothetical protein